MRRFSTSSSAQLHARRPDRDVRARARGDHLSRSRDCSAASSSPCSMRDPARGRRCGRSGRSRRGCAARCCARPASCAAGPRGRARISWKRMSASTERCRSPCGGLAHLPDLLRDLAEVLVGHLLDGLREAELLEHRGGSGQHLAAPPRPRRRARPRRDTGTRRRSPRARAGGAPRAPGRGSSSARARSAPRSAARRPRASRRRSRRERLHHLLAAGARLAVCGSGGIVDNLEMVDNRCGGA